MVTPGDGLPLERRLLKEETRRKLLHPVGAVGRVQWRDLGGHGYTALWAWMVVFSKSVVLTLRR